MPRRELALALVCAGLLMLEICLTKIFSIVLWYHFGFLAVSTALLGFASSGVYLTLRERHLDESNADESIAGSAAFAAVFAVLSLWLMTQTTFDVYSVVADREIGSLVAFVIWTTIPFFFLGLVISKTLSAFPERVNRLYGADLVGSAAGCGLAVLALSLGYSGQAAILSAGALIAVGGLMFASGRILPTIVNVAALAVPVVVLVSSDPEVSFPLRSPPSKPYYKVEAFDRIRAEKEKGGWYRGIQKLKDGTTIEVEVPEQPELTADGKRVKVWTDDGPAELPIEDLAPRADGTGLDFERVAWPKFRLWTSLSRVDAFHYPQPYGAYGLWGLSPLAESEVEGPMPRQKGITIDAWAMTQIMRYSGEPLYPPGTPEVDAERAKLKVLEFLPAGAVHRIRPAPDHIVCIGAGGGLDLLTAKYFGAKKITGVEINQGVVDSVRKAFPEFAGHLYDPEKHPDVDVHVAEGRHFLERSEDKYDVLQLSGVDTFSTTEAGAFSLSENYLYTVEAFKTYARHLKPNGVFTLTRWFYPRIDEELGKLDLRASLRLIALARTALSELGVDEPGRGIFFFKSNMFTVILVKPEGFERVEIGRLTDFCEEYRYDVLWNPYAETPQIPLQVEGALKMFPNSIQAYMTASDPDAFLADQEFDVTPPRDDRPFFFEVSRFSQILERDHLFNPIGGLTAHGLLILIFLEVLVLGFLFVVYPLRRLALRHVFPHAKRVRAGVLVYFTAIGFGFIVVEIVLSQKFVLFLGHPFYSLAVILFSTLLFSGLGAMLSTRFPIPRFATAVVAVVALLPGLFFQGLFEAALSLPLAARIAISVAILAPLGLLMGVPFPSGIAVLREVRPSLIPWAWGINGYTSVLGSVLAVILGIELGFVTVLAIAGAVYATGVLGYHLMDVRDGAAEEPADGADYDDADFDDELAAAEAERGL